MGGGGEERGAKLDVTEMVPLCQALVRPSFQVFGTWFFLFPAKFKKMEGKDPLDPLLMNTVLPYIMWKDCVT